MKDAGNFYLSETFYFSRFFFFSVYLETVGEILFLNFSRRNVNFLLLHARKIEKKFCFETKFRLRRGSVAEDWTQLRFYFDLKNLSLLPDKFIHLIFMGRQFKIPRISFAHIAHFHPLSGIYLGTKDNFERNYTLSNICLISVRLIPLYPYHCFYLNFVVEAAF